MARNESVEHHFVPRFLLRPWAVEGLLRGYWWDERRGILMCKRKGPRAFCFRLDLLTLHAHRLGRDVLERLFFGDIDTKGAAARNRLLDVGPIGLTGEERCDFARLLLSLEARRPSNVSKLRDYGRQHLAEALDNDPEVLELFSDEGIVTNPSSFFEQESGISLADRALVVIQRLVDNERVGGKLINAHWHVVHLSLRDGSFVLADRPLIRVRDYDHPGITVTVY